MSEGNGPGGARPVALTTEAMVERLHAGTLHPARLTASQRRRCVGHLSEQALTAGEIAQVMGVAPRTVHRDRAALRRQAAMGPDLKLGDELLGEFERVVAAANARLTRLGRDPNVPAYVRLRAEEAQVRNYQRLIRTARQLDYVDSGRSRLSAQRRAAQADPANEAYLDPLTELRRLGLERG